MVKANYQELVHDIARLIPSGRVTSYGAIADYLALGSARMVGWAMYNCTPQDGVPAHRVVNSKGELSGRAHFRPPSLMQQLLEAEGVKVENDRVLNFKEVFWHPEELGW
jgi:methylated-DNA-protein-cysteine methyltransferase related protein